jgi:hypothetical protein
MHVLKETKIVKIFSVSENKTYSLTFKKALGNQFYLLNTDGFKLFYFNHIVNFYAKLGKYSKYQNFIPNGFGGVSDYYITSFSERTTNAKHSNFDKIINPKSNPNGKLKNRIFPLISRDELIRFINGVTQRERQQTSLKILSENRY